MLSRALRKRGGPSSCRKRRQHQGPTLATLPMVGMRHSSRIYLFNIKKKMQWEIVHGDRRVSLNVSQMPGFPTIFPFTSEQYVMDTAALKNYRKIGTRWADTSVEEKLPVMVKGVWHRAHSWATLMQLQGFSACSEARSRAEWEESSGWAVQNSAVTQLNTTAIQPYRYKNTVDRM